MDDEREFPCFEQLAEVVEDMQPVIARVAAQKWNAKMISEAGIDIQDMARVIAWEELDRWLLMLDRKKERDMAFEDVLESRLCRTWRNRTRKKEGTE